MTKWRGRKDIIETQRGINHVSPTSKENTLSEINQKTNEHIAKNHRTTSGYAADFVSKTFGNIVLREIRDPRYTAEDIKNFFTNFDSARVVRLYVDEKYRPYVDGDSVVMVTVGDEQFVLSARLMWFCLSDDVKAPFIQIKSYFKQIESLFAAYNRKMIVESFDK